MSKKNFQKISSILKMQKRENVYFSWWSKPENEGEISIPGSKCNSKIINFMVKHGRGLICFMLTKQIEKLKLPLMSQINKSRMQTAFTVSRERNITGISAFDRANYKR